MDYRGFQIRKRQYSGPAFYVAIQPRIGGGSFGDVVASDPSPVGIMRRVDEAIVAGRPQYSV